MSGKLHTGSSIDKDQVLTPDVCIVGSGAGGAVTAATLARAGAHVVVLEEGGAHTRSEFNMRESDMYPLLYQDRGNRATADLSMIILQGRAMGGSTVVNWTTCFRTPESVLQYWEKVHGVEGYSPKIMNSAFQHIEERLNIHQVTHHDVNRNNQILWDGAQTLGWKPELLKRNVSGCIRSGYCGMGCPVDAKQSMNLTYLPDALSHGADIYTNCRVEKLATEAGRITEVQASILNESSYTPNGKKVTVRPKRVIVSGGSINSPALLLRSGLKDSSELTGRRMFFHPVIATAALFDDPIEGFYGAPQSVSCHHFAQGSKDHMGYFLEVPPVHPMLASLALPGFGERHAKFMKRLAHVNVLISLLIDGFDPQESGARVSVKRNGALKIDYAYTRRFWKSAQECMKSTARIQLITGAREVQTLHEDPITIGSESELSKIDKAPTGPLRHSIFTAHQMGGCSMGGNRKTSVVNPELKHWSYKNLYVIDGSIFPTSLGVNPQETIYGVASVAAERLAEKG